MYMDSAQIWKNQALYFSVDHTIPGNNLLDGLTVILHSSLSSAQGLPLR